MRRLSISLAIAALALTSDAFAQDVVGRFSPGELTKRTLERRAVEAAIWGMPIVSFDVMALPEIENLRPTIMLALRH